MGQDEKDVTSENLRSLIQSNNHNLRTSELLTAVKIGLEGEVVVNLQSFIFTPLPNGSTISWGRYGIKLTYGKIPSIGRSQSPTEL